MREVTASVSRVVSAAPEYVYQVFADYTHGHKRILADELSDYRVLEGGRGVGTVVEFTVTTGAGVRRFTVEVTEPEPGRILAETDRATSTVTRFTVEPDAAGSRVTITTSFPASPPPRGWVERLLAPRMLRQMYAKEIAKLSDYVAKQH